MRSNDFYQKEVINIRTAKKLGYVSDFVQNPPGTYITIGVGVVVILLVFLPDFFKKKPKETE